MAKAKPKAEPDEKPTGTAIEKLLLFALIMVVAIAGLAALGSTGVDMFEAVQIKELSKLDLDSRQSSSILRTSPASRTARVTIFTSGKRKKTTI